MHIIAIFLIWFMIIFIILGLVLQDDCEKLMKENKEGTDEKPGCSGKASQKQQTNEQCKNTLKEGINYLDTYEYHLGTWTEDVDVALSYAKDNKSIIMGINVTESNSSSCKKYWQLEGYTKSFLDWAKNNNIVLLKGVYEKSTLPGPTISNETETANISNETITSNINVEDPYEIHQKGLSDELEESAIHNEPLTKRIVPEDQLLNSPSSTTTSTNKAYNWIKKVLGVTYDAWPTIVFVNYDLTVIGDFRAIESPITIVNNSQSKKTARWNYNTPEILPLFLSTMGSTGDIINRGTESKNCYTQSRILTISRELQIFGQEDDNKQSIILKPINWNDSEITKQLTDEQKEQLSDGISSIPVGQAYTLYDLTDTSVDYCIGIKDLYDVQGEATIYFYQSLGDIADGLSYKQVALKELVDNPEPFQYYDKYCHFIIATKGTKEIRYKITTQIVDKPIQEFVIEENPDWTDKEISDFKKDIANNFGYCPCKEKSEDTKCICKTFKETQCDSSCKCECGLYVKYRTNPERDISQKLPEIIKDQSSQSESSV